MRDAKPLNATVTCAESTDASGCWHPSCLQLPLETEKRGVKQQRLRSIPGPQSRKTEELGLQQAHETMLPGVDRVEVSGPVEAPEMRRQCPSKHGGDPRRQLQLSFWRTGQALLLAASAYQMLTSMHRAAPFRFFGESQSMTTPFADDDSSRPRLPRRPKTALDCPDSPTARLPDHAEATRGRGKHDARQTGPILPPIHSLPPHRTAWVDWTPVHPHQCAA